MATLLETSKAKERRAAMCAFLHNSPNKEALVGEIYEHMSALGYSPKNVRNDLVRLKSWSDGTIVIEHEGTVLTRTDIVKVVSKEKEPVPMKNSEGYSDPTAAEAINKTLGSFPMCGEVEPGDIWFYKTYSTSRGETIGRFLVLTVFDDGGVLGFDVKEYKAADVGFNSACCYKFMCDGEDLYINLHRLKSIAAYILKQNEYFGFLESTNMNRINERVRLIFGKPSDEALKNENEALRDQNAKLGAKILDLEDTIKRSTDLGSKFADVNRDLMAKVESLENEKITLQTDITAKRDIIDDLKVTIDEYAKELEELRNKTDISESPKGNAIDVNFNIPEEILKPVKVESNPDFSEFYHRIIEKLIDKLPSTNIEITGR